MYEIGVVHRNIERTDCYEPLVVRPHPNKHGFFQIINGHCRCKAYVGQDVAAEAEIKFMLIDELAYEEKDQPLDA